MATSKIPRKHFLTGLGGLFLGVISLLRVGGRSSAKVKATPSVSSKINLKPDPRSVAQKDG